MINGVLVNMTDYLATAQVIQKDPVITKIVTEVLGVVLNFIYNVVANFTVTNSLGWSIIIFTIFVRLLMVPLAVKQQHSMVKMQSVQPEVTKIQSKYKDNKDPEVQKKMQAEIQSLYSKNGVNPLSGCLPLFIQMPIFIALSYMMRNAYIYIDKLAVVYQNIIATIASTATSQNPLGVVIGQIISDNHITTAGGTTLDLKNSIPDVEKVLNIFNTGNWNTLIGAAQSDVAAALTTQLETLQKMEHFFGIDLTGYAGLTFPGILIPIFAIVTSTLSSYFAMKMSPPANEAAAKQQKMMLYIMPIVIGFSTMNLSAGVGLYWITSSGFQTVQQVIINKHVKKIREDAENAKLEEKSKLEANLKKQGTSGKKHK